jgi:hypothetical protein
MTGRRFVFIGLGMCLAAAYACSGKASSPTSPSTGAAASSLPAANALIRHVEFGMIRAPIVAAQMSFEIGTDRLALFTLVTPH